MTVDQAAILILMAVLLAAFAWDRLRIEIVALCGLAAGLVLGLVPMAGAFDGFASPAVITVAEILIIVQLLLRSHFVDWIAAGLARRVSGEFGVLAVVCCLGAALSVFMNNIGALALMLPLTFSLCRSAGVRPGTVLMPLSYATLLGGTCSLIGTPANLVVSSFRTPLAGTPLAFFEIAIIGLPVTLVGLCCLVASAPRLLKGRGLERISAEISGPRRFVAELRVRPGTTLEGLSVVAIETELGGIVHAHMREGRHVFGRRDRQNVAVGDVLLCEIDVAVAMDLAGRGTVDLSAGRPARDTDEWLEAVVLPQSTILGSTMRSIEAFSYFGVELVAISPQTPRIEGSLADIAISVGDVMLLRGEPGAVRAALEEVNCLAISPRGVAAPRPQGWATLAAFVLAIGAAATGYVPPPIAFGAAILALAVGRVTNLRAAMADLNWPILLMLAAMIPLGTAIETTKAADVVAHGLLTLTGASGAFGVAAVILAATILVTSFVNNVSTVIALVPVAEAAARSTGLWADPLLLLVAVGASFDFLTPFGHHNNTLVMGLGDYRFGDFPRLGAPLTAAASVAALLVVTLMLR